MARVTWISEEVNLVGKIVHNTCKPFPHILDDDGKSKKHYDILIKVSNLAVHKTLVGPCATESAFKDLRGSECKALSDVLVAVWLPSSASLVTIMKDLTKCHYQSLEPCNVPNVLVLWISFVILVHEVLLPLA